MSDNIEDQSNKGWTQYQKLVLAELGRHDEKQEGLDRKIIEIQLSFAELKVQLAQNNAAINNLLAEIKILDKARENQNLNLKAIQWKITTFAAGASSIIAILTQILMNFFLKK